MTATPRHGDVDPKTRCLFLDRDGVINVDRAYVHRIEDFEFVPGIFNLARFVSGELGWRLVVVTNQSGLGRGVFDMPAYSALTEWMCQRFALKGAALSGVYYCPYHPTEGRGLFRTDDPCRKPRPGMILQAAHDLGLSLPHSALLGDKQTDIDAGAAAGIGLLMLLVGQGPSAAVHPHNPVRMADIPEAERVLRRLVHAAGRPAG